MNPRCPSHTCENQNLIEESLSEFAVRESESRQAEVCQRIGGGNFLRQTKAFICSLLSITRPSWCQAFCHANIDVLRVLVAAFSWHQHTCLTMILLLIIASICIIVHITARQFLRFTGRCSFSYGIESGITSARAMHDLELVLIGDTSDDVKRIVKIKSFDGSEFIPRIADLLVRKHGGEVCPHFRFISDPIAKFIDGIVQEPGAGTFKSCYNIKCYRRSKILNDELEMGIYPRGVVPDRIKYCGWTDAKPSSFFHENRGLGHVSADSCFLCSNFHLLKLAGCDASINSSGNEGEDCGTSGNHLYGEMMFVAGVLLLLYCFWYLQFRIKDLRSLLWLLPLLAGCFLLIAYGTYLFLDSQESVTDSLTQRGQLSQDALGDQEKLSGVSHIESLVKISLIGKWADEGNFENHKFVAWDNYFFGVDKPYSTWNYRVFPPDFPGVAGMMFLRTEICPIRNAPDNEGINIRRSINVLSSFRRKLLVYFLRVDSQVPILLLWPLREYGFGKAAIRWERRYCSRFTARFLDFVPRLGYTWEHLKDFLVFCNANCWTMPDIIFGNRNRKMSSKRVESEWSSNGNINVQPRTIAGDQCIAGSVSRTFSGVGRFFVGPVHFDRCSGIDNQDDKANGTGRELQFLVETHVRPASFETDEDSEKEPFHFRNSITELIIGILVLWIGLIFLLAILTWLDDFLSWGGFVFCFSLVILGIIIIHDGFSAF